jgi:hypothetical protein
MTTNYVSIKSVLHDLSSMIDERYWNESAMEEWITKALRQLNIEPALEQAVALLEICEHKAQLPSDLKYLTQITYKATPMPEDELAAIIADLDLPSNSNLFLYHSALKNLKWLPLRLATNPFHNSICLDETLTKCLNCQYEFTVSPSMVLTTNLRSGLILVSYLRFPVDEDGSALIPDNETLKEAILHYALYRYWMTRYIMKEDGADSRVKFHSTMWDTLSKKALNLNLPDLSMLENIKNQRNRLVPRSRMFQNNFMNLNSEENVDF